MNGMDFLEGCLAMDEMYAKHNAKCQYIYDTELNRLNGNGSESYNNCKDEPIVIKQIFEKVEECDICLCKKCKHSENSIVLTDEQFEKLFKLFKEKLK